MRITTIIAASALFAVPAMGEEHHTASWYQAHPAEMNAKMQACNDDPGYAVHDPNCENAHQARIATSADDAKAQYFAMIHADEIKQQRHLIDHPEYLLARLKVCNRLSDPVDRRINSCPIVFAAAQEYLRAQRGQQP